MIKSELHFRLNLISGQLIRLKRDLAKAKWTLAVCLFCLTLFLPARTVSTSVPPPAPIGVNKTATRASLAQRELIVSLAVENNTSAALPVECAVDLLDPGDRVVAEGARSATVAPGSGVIPFTMTLPEVKAGQKHGILSEDSSGIGFATASNLHRAA